MEGPCWLIPDGPQPAYEDPDLQDSYHPSSSWDEPSVVGKIYPKSYWIIIGHVVIFFVDRTKGHLSGDSCNLVPNAA